MVTVFCKASSSFDFKLDSSEYHSVICIRQRDIDAVISYQKSCDGVHLLLNSTSLKFLDEGKWISKKSQPEYRRQWRKTAYWYK